MCRKTKTLRNTDVEEQNNDLYNAIDLSMFAHCKINTWKLYFDLIPVLLIVVTSSESKSGHRLSDLNQQNNLPVKPNGVINGHDNNIYAEKSSNDFTKDRMARLAIIIPDKNKVSYVIGELKI